MTLPLEVVHNHLQGGTFRKNACYILVQALHTDGRARDCLCPSTSFWLTTTGSQQPRNFPPLWRWYGITRARTSRNEASGSNRTVPELHPDTWWCQPARHGETRPGIGQRRRPSSSTKIRTKGGQQGQTCDTAASLQMVRDASLSAIDGRTLTKRQHRLPSKVRLREKSRLRGTLGLKGTASVLVADVSALIDFSLESALRHAHQDCAVVIENPRRSWLW